MSSASRTVVTSAASSEVCVATHSLVRLYSDSFSAAYVTSWGQHGVYKNIWAVLQWRWQVEEALVSKNGDKNNFFRCQKFQIAVYTPQKRYVVDMFTVR